MSVWYYAEGQEKKGPLPEEEIRRLAKQGVVKPLTLVWNPGMPSWLPFAEAPEFAGLAAPPPPVPKAAAAASPAAPASSGPPPTPSAASSSSPPPLAPVAADAGPPFVTAAGAVLNKEEGVCPTCGYFCGASPTCYRCGARVQRRISVALVKALSVAGSVIGVVLLWYAAHLKTPQTVKVGDITEMMNGALVKIEGRVTQYQEDPAKNNVRFTVDDGSGEISVSVFNHLTQFKEVLGERMPALGDEVVVTGALSESQRFGASIFLSIPERLALVKKNVVEEVDIAEITDADIDKVVKVEARIDSYESRETMSGTMIHLITLDDGTKSIGLTVFGREWDALSEEKRGILSGTGGEISIAIKIDSFRGRLQAKLSDPESIKLVSPPSEAPASDDAGDTAAAADTAPAALAPAPAPAARRGRR